MATKSYRPPRKSVARRKKMRGYMRNGSSRISGNSRLMTATEGVDDWPWFGSQIRYTIKVFRQTIKDIKAARSRKQRLPKPVSH